MRRRVLIVTSSYAPAMIADMHRARHLAWDLPAAGWDVEILCPGDGYQQPSCMDNDSAEFFTPDAIAHYVPEFLPRLFRWLGFGSIGWRALLPMLRTGRRLLLKRQFDLIYFSTTQFPLFLLGPAWRLSRGVPYVLDIHDPIIRETAARADPARTGLKHAAGRWLARHIESLSVSAAAGVVSVSPEYLEALRRRYENRQPAWLQSDRQAVIPFAVAERDFKVARGAGIAGAKASRPIRIVYVGAGGPVMQRAFRLFCKAIAYLRRHEPNLLADVRIELYGTMLGWRDGDPSYLADIAGEWGIADLVVENPRRVSYRKSMELLLAADGTLIFGVDDGGYMPSKLFAYALSGHPVLATVRRDSPAFAYFATLVGLGLAIWFDQFGELAVEEAAQQAGNFLREAAVRTKIDRRAMLVEFLAPAMARRHAALFEACLRQS
jgi:glycosyltransferase involved in cell wall biosynthesis